MLYAVLALTAAALAQAQVSHALHTISSIWRMRSTGGCWKGPELDDGHTVAFHVVPCTCKVVFLITFGVPVVLLEDEDLYPACPTGHRPPVLHASLLGRRTLPSIDAAW